MNIGKNFGETVDKIKDTMNNIEFDPNKRINEFKENMMDTIKDVFNPDSRVSEFNSTEEERISFTPSDNTDRGTWESGSRGNGEFVPSKNTEEGLEVTKALAKYDVIGIEYKKGVPDFSKCSKDIVSINNMTYDRYSPSGNFKQADAQLAKQWNDSKKDDRTDWTARDIKTFRKDNRLTWHECSDMKTCMLVDRSIHDFFGHTGGVFEYKKGLESNDDGGIFDE